MMIRKNAPSVQRNGLRLAFASMITLAGLTGCGSLSTVLEPDRLDYKSAGKAPTLEVPPDLTQLQRENRYTIPEASRGTATASGYSSQQTARPVSASVIAPAAASDVRMDRAGNQRWLVVKQSPEVLWPQIKDFWQDSGFLINLELPDAGVLETDWAENRAKIPQGFIRNTLGKALDALYSTGERDKFRTRLERAPDGSTEIYISHRGAQEVVTGVQKDSTVWTQRPSDPELEAEFLARLMVRLGVQETKAKAVFASAPQQPHAKLVKNSGGAYVEVDEGFDRAWRRVGLALDRVGFTVEDRDRTQGMYFVRYVDQGQDAQNKAPSEKGLFSKLFSFGSSDKGKSAQRYRVSVKASGEISQVAVLNNDGHTETSATADKILSLLSEQLK